MAAPRPAPPASPPCHAWNTARHRPGPPLSRRALLAGLAGGALALAARAGIGPPLRAAPLRQERPRIVVAGPGGSGDISEMRFRTEIEAYARINPEVEVVYRPSGDPLEYRATLPLIATSGEPPDVAWYWLGDRRFRELVAQGLLAPLDDLYAAEGWDQVLREPSLAIARGPDGRRYGVNEQIVWYPVLYFNLALYQQAGVSRPAVTPYYRNLDEWFAVTDGLRAAGIQPLTFGGDDIWTLGHLHDALLQRLVPEEQLREYARLAPRAPRGTVRFTDDAFLAAARTMLDWQRRGVFAAGFMDLDYAAGRARYVNGEAAIYMDGSWALSQSVLYAEAPDMDYGWMLLPQLRPEIRPRFLLYASGGLVVFASSPQIEVAKQFVAFVMSKKRQEALAYDIHFVPSRTDVDEGAIRALGRTVHDMWKRLVDVGTAVGWSESVHYAVAQRSLPLLAEMMAGRRTPESVGEALERVLLE